jgi:hypothetical protein
MVLRPAIQWIPVIILGLAACVGAGQKKTALTARELFYSAPGGPAPATAQPKTGQPKQETKTIPAKKAPQTATRKRPPKTSSDTPAAEPVVAAAGAEPHGEVLQGAHLAAVSDQPMVPLGLRYSILKYAGDDEYVEVDPDLVYHSGDRIRLRVEVNSQAYLYIVMQGSSGNWRVLFPSPEYDDGTNLVAPGRAYDIPSRTRFVFDEQPGTEKLFFVLSRQPEQDLDKLIYQLDSGGAPAAAPTAGGPPKAQPVKTMMAMNTINISDALVERLRGQVLARDLVFEKVSEDKPKNTGATKKEKAVYVVNPSRQADSRLVADVELRHR